jgi:hypothetical protein
VRGPGGPRHSMMRVARISLLLFVGGACQQPATPAKPWRLEDSVGLAVWRSGRLCLSLPKPALARNSAIRLVDPSLPQRQWDARVWGRDDSCPGGDPDEAALQRYEIRPAKAGAEPAGPLITLASFAGSFRQQGGVVSADLDGDGVDEHFRTCASAEGLHYTIWSGEPLNGRLRWHRYHYLGYDVDPTCTPKDFGPVK